MTDRSVGLHRLEVVRGTIIDIGDHSVEILETPSEAGDRCQLRSSPSPAVAPASIATGRPKLGSGVRRVS